MTCYNCESTVLAFRCDACKEQFCSVKCLREHLEVMEITNPEDTEYFIVKLGGSSSA